MGDVNQFELIEELTERFEGPFLEVGARNYGSTYDLRSLFPREDYIGIDQEGGEGVDVALDCTRPFADIDRLLGNKRFGTIFCLSVLEHCAQPFLMADNMVRLLRPGGKIFVSVPFAWKFHGYPSDYWRFTHEGVKQLFPLLDWDLVDGCMTTSRKGERRMLDKDIGLVSLSGARYRSRGNLLRALSADLLKILGRVGLLRWLVGYRYLLAPTMVNMIGTKAK